MDIGMLWFDDDKKRDTVQKIERAAAYYENKYGVYPTTCYVNPSLLSDGVEGWVGFIRVIGNKTVIKDHFWLGVENDGKKNA